MCRQGLRGYFIGSSQDVKLLNSSNDAYKVLAQVLGYQGNSKTKIFPSLNSKTLLYHLLSITPKK